MLKYAILGPLALSLSLLVPNLVHATPIIPSTLEQYGFIHQNFDAAHNDLKDFVSYTDTGFASTPSQVPLVIAAGFKNIIYIMSQFYTASSPLLAQFVADEHIQLNGTPIDQFDYRTIPNYETKMLALYKQQITMLRDQLVANGTLDKITAFYIADEPALHRNYIPDQAFLDAIDSTFKEVFPGKRSIMAFAEDRTSPTSFKSAHLNPPPTLDIIAMDPYFQDAISVDCTESGVSNYLYTTNPNSALNWAFKFNKPVYLLGDAMLRNGKPLPLCYIQQTFNVAKKDARIKGLDWFIYDSDNLDGGTYLSGAGSNPTVVNYIKSLTLSTTAAPAAPTPTPTPTTVTAPVPAVTSAPVTPTVSASQCVDLTANATYGDSDESDRQTVGEVKKLQQFLYAHGYLRIAPTGYFGSGTYKAVQAFQNDSGITGTGNSGPRTRAAIAQASGCSASSGNDTTAPTAPVPPTPPVVTPAPAVTVVPPVSATAIAPTITVTPDETIPAGGTATVSWKVTPATNVSCTVSGGTFAPGTAVMPSGEWTTPALFASTSYTLQCNAAQGGAAAYKKFRVTVTPTATQPLVPPPATATSSVVTPTNVQTTPVTTQSTVVAPHAYLSQSKDSTATNEQFTVTWSSTAATSCTFETNTNNRGWTTDGTGTSGSRVYSPLTVGSYQGRLSCYGASGTLPSVVILSHTITAPVITCVSGQVLVNGSCVPATTAYTCPDGSSVQVPTGSSGASYCPVTTPSLTYSSSATTITNGQSVTLSWSVANATTCMIQNLNTGMFDSVPTSGSKTYSPTAPTYYQLYCQNDPLDGRTAKSAYQSIFINVLAYTPPPVAPTPTIDSLSASPASITAGQMTTVSWASSNTSQCFGQNNSTGTIVQLASTGSTQLGPTSTTSYRLWCTNGAGVSAERTITITVTAPAATDTCAALDASLYCTTQSCTTNTGVVRYGTKNCSVLGASIACVDLPYNFHRGEESKWATKLQDFLSSKGYLTASSSGFYGDKTVAAVKAYQAAHGLPATGMVFDFTRKAIKQETCQ